MNKWGFIAFLLIGTLVIGQHSLTQKKEFSFLFIGHAYDWSVAAGDRVDERIEMIDLNQYDGFWLGGDVCANPLLNPQTVDYLDGLFDFKNPNTHYILGNHEYRDHNLDVYYEATGRPDFYSVRFRNLMVSVLNTNLNSSQCESLNAQYRMLETVIDTLETATHYVMLMHHQIFRDIQGIETFKSNGICQYYSMNCHRADSYFHSTIYPQLVDLESKGIEVIVIVGDTGWDKGVEVESDDGISFIASGINNSYYKSKAPNDLNSIEKDMLLEINYLPEEGVLNWKFIALNELADISTQEWLDR